MSGVLESERFPESWRLVAFGRLVDRVQNDGRPDLMPLSVYLNAGVVPRSSRDDNHNRLGADLSRYLTVNPGDVVFNKLRTWQGGFGCSKYQGLVSPAYFVCRPKSQVDPRYLDYLLHSVPYLQELSRISKWMPPSQFDIGWDDLKQLPIATPPPSHQRAIADFLDAETARIDALIAKKRALAWVTLEAFQTRRYEVLTAGIGGLDAAAVGAPSLRRSDNNGWTRVRVRRLVGFPTGGVWGEERGLDEQDVVCLRVADFDRSAAVACNVEPTVRSISRSQLSRLKLELGDLLLEKSGGGEKQPVGFVAQYREPSADLPHVTSNFIAKLRTTSLADSDYLRHLFGLFYRLRLTEPYIKQTTGIQNLDVSAFLDQQWYVPPIAEQRAMALALDRSYMRAKRIRDALQAQIELLQERRRALVTAAVTGQMEVPGVGAA